MHTKNEYKLKLENTIPFSTKELKQYENRVGFDYIQAIGELIYAMVTYRPDISFPIIKLAQYSTKPSETYFEPVKEIY